MDNEAILAVRNPSHRVGGPYAVVHKHIKQEWAIVALSWKKDDVERPTLGIRYFGPNASTDFPMIGDESAWLLLPDELHRGVLLSLNLEAMVHYNVLQFLDAAISGQQLRERLTQRESG